MRVNAYDESFEYIELFGKPALLTENRIQTDTIPEGWYCYDLRGSDTNPSEPVTVEPLVAVNHAGTILTHEPVTIPKSGYRSLKGRLDFLGERYSLKEFCEVRGLNYPDNPRKYALRPASVRCWLGWNRTVPFIWRLSTAVRQRTPANLSQRRRNRWRRSIPQRTAGARGKRRQTPRSIRVPKRKAGRSDAELQEKQYLLPRRGEG